MAPFLQTTAWGWGGLNPGRQQEAPPSVPPLVRLRWTEEGERLTRPPWQLIFAEDKEDVDRKVRRLPAKRLSTCERETASRCRCRIFTALSRPALGSFMHFLRSELGPGFKMCAVLSVIMAAH